MRNTLVITALGLGVWVAVAACEEHAAESGPPEQPQQTGRTIYLNPEGLEENPGTARKPNKDIEQALRSLKAGDTLVFQKGVYRIGKIRLLGKFLQGTEDKPITIRGEDGAVLEGLFRKATNTASHGPDKPSGIAVEGRCRWVTVENLEMRNNGTLNVAHGSEHVTYRNCHIHDYSNYGLLVNRSKWLTLENCRIHGSAIEHGIYLTSDNKDTVIRGCEFYDTAINGIHINGSENQRILVENCTFHHNSRNWGACITLMGAREITIRNNVFYSNRGHIFTITAGKAEANVARAFRILHNTIYQPQDSREGQVFVVRSPLRDVLVHNNVFDTNTRALDMKSDAVVDSTDFDYNVYGPDSGDQMKQAGKEKHGLFGVKVRYCAPPDSKPDKVDLHILPDRPASSGAPLLKDLCPTGKDGKKRRANGPFGAYAEVGGKDS